MSKLTSQIPVLVSSIILWCAISTNSTTVRTLTYTVEFDETDDQNGMDDVSSNQLTKDERSFICGKVIEEAVFELIKNREVAKPDHPQSPVLDRFTCPELPAVHVIVNEGENESTNVTLTAPPKDISSLHVILYKIQRIKQILEISHSGEPAADSASITDRFTKEDRLRMCKEAAIILSHTNIEWLTDVDVGEVKSYELTTKENREHSENVHAFQCPTLGTIILTVPKLVRGRICSRLLIEKRAPSLDRFAPEFRYSLRIASSINESDSDEDSFLVPAEYNERKRHKICHEASEIIPDDEDLSWSAVGPREENIYEIETMNEQGALTSEVVLAFECSTHPPIYPQPYVDRDMRMTIEVYVREAQFSNVAMRKWHYLM